ncbi:hypothetical protein FB45DRAFT_804033, partial [Roridomyces roridus]
MFSNSTNFQFSNGNFYNVSGDVNLAVQQRFSVRAPDSGANIGMVDGAAAGHPQRLINGSSSSNQEPVSDPAGDDDLPGFTDTPPSATPHPHAFRDGIYITTPNVNNVFHTSDIGVQILHRHATLDALYNSAESFPQPRCHPETRTELLERLWGQIMKPNIRVIWLHGSAGAGKSAIMQTLCEGLQAADQLGGSFFFKRGHSSRGSGRPLFLTLAYQLALFDPVLKPLILETVRRDPSLAATSIASQLKELIVQPCLSAAGCQPRILLVDGLDECDGSDIQQEILRSICKIFSQHALPVKIIIASRPEPDIRAVFEDPSFHGLQKTNVEQSFLDVEIFLRREFSRIHREHGESMALVPSPWPSGDVIRALVQKSSGYFIYAATVIKFIDDKQFLPTEQLEIIFNADTQPDSLPFQNLDQLYIQILSQVPVRYCPRLLQILSVIS